MRLKLVCGILALAAMSASMCRAQSIPAVLGAAAAAIDPAKAAQVRAGVAGTRFYFDTNGDGKPEECWFIDTDPRHSISGILVKAIDGDGDMASGKQPDHDSDIYLADTNGDNVADKAVFYEDYDHDGDMDAMAVSYSSYWWWARDDGDDNRLWYDRNYSYDQNTCQDQCGFGADESFFALDFNATTKIFSPHYEAPFYFWDNDRDGRCDDVMRITITSPSTPTSVYQLRWSFNPTGYGTAEDPRHYVCSISGHPVAGMTIGSQWLENGTLHGYPIQQMLARSKAREWVNASTWKDGMFTWVENGNNVAWASGDSYSVKSERWEGVIAASATNWTRVGGPDCGPYNNRYELDLAPTGPFKYYYNPADHRIHLKHANTAAWLETDWDANAAGDMKYTWTDTNGDGLLDHVAFDVDDNGTADDQWDLATDQIQNLDFEWQAFHDIIAPLLQTYPAQLYDLDRSLAAALEAVQAGSSADAVWTFIENKYSNSSIPEWRRKKFLAQDNTLMYYLELVRDRQIVKLKARAGGGGYTSFWTTFNAARASGDTDAMASALRGKFGPASPSWTPFAAWIANLRAENIKRVNSSAAWLPNGIAWETERAAWRIQNGRFDFLGKRDVHYFGLASSNYKPLVLDGITASTDISKDSATAWGMDALNEGTGPGAGGLTLYVNDTAYPLYGTGVSATYSVVEQTNERVTVEMLVGNAGPAASPRTVRVRATALAGRADTSFEATVQGGSASDKLELGIGLTRPADSAFEHRQAGGILGIWGFQTPAIDWVGLGVIYPAAQYSRLVEAPGEIDVVLKATLNQAVGWTVANDWRRGRRFSFFPVLADWMDELGRIAGAGPLTRNAAHDWKTML
ncbi:MAG: DUF4861 family protein [Candidatus Sumerlaeia bacterium]